ncbi:MAG TPA: hypothetical protein VFF06_28850 [Polyangia bacterium]|nr:hypothetical protein [Polyangia bacterium]
MSGPAELAALARKYRVMAELRRTLPGHALGENDDALDETPEQREALRRLAAEFPGALRELDTLETDELERRRDALAAAAAGGAVEPWMRWLDGYHSLMRAALAVKRRLATRRPVDAEARAEIAAATGAAVDEELVRAVAAPPHGRLNVVVFERLGALHGEPAKKIWDALYPPRAPGSSGRGYRG